MSVATDRRLFLRFLGAGVTGAVGSSIGPLGPIVAASGPMPFQEEQVTTSTSSFLTFDPIKPSSDDNLLLPPGFEYQTILAYGDRFTRSSERFGFNADFTAFLPRNPEGYEGLLVVNHEYVGTATDNYGQAFAEVVGGVPTLADYKFDVGMSVVYLRKNPSGSWVILPSDLNRRITADTLMVADGPALQGESNVGATLGNCSGGHTPWNTVLTCEDIAFTATPTAQNSLFTNIYGELVRLVEVSGGTGNTFTWQRWKAGGPNNEALGGHIFAAPDNLSFDKAANLWVVSDISSANLNGGNANYTAFRNNGMFFIPTAGAHSGTAFQSASGPCESELTGPAWTPDEQTLFLAVQHPGESSGTRRGAVVSPRGSNWPRGGDRAPLPAVVAIQRRE